jgi:hypothetical protein
MSKSIEPVINAFLSGKSKKISNTETDGSNLWLFGNCIAKKGVDGIFICDGSYKHTQTTQDRLNMLGAGVTFIKGQFYIKGIKWNGSWLKLHEAPENQEIKEQRKSIF